MMLGLLATSSSATAWWPAPLMQRKVGFAGVCNIIVILLRNIDVWYSLELPHFYILWVPLMNRLTGAVLMNIHSYEFLFLNDKELAIGPIVAYVTWAVGSGELK